MHAAPAVSFREHEIDLRAFKHSRGAALKITSWFVVSAGTWIVLSDYLVQHWIEDPQLMARLQAAQGWIFVAVAGLVVHFSAAHNLARAQRSVAMQRALVENINDGVVVVASTKNIVGVNPATLRMLGVADSASLLGMDGAEFARMFRLSRPDGRLIPVEEYASARALRGEVLGTHRAVVHPRGGRPPLHITVTAAPVRATPDGPVELSVTVLRDVEAIERLESMRDEFFAAAAHWLKTPITTISLHAQLLATECDFEPRRKVARVIVRQCGRIEWLVRNLLVASRLRHGGLTFHMEAVDLTELARQAVGELREREPQVPLELVVEPGLNVFADRQRLELVLANLMTQAYLAAPSSEPVKLSVTRRAQCVRVVVATARPLHDPDVTDEIPAEVIRARFDRVRDAGVALYVSQGIVEAHGSRLERGLGAGDAWLTWFEVPALVSDAEASA